MNSEELWKTISEKLKAIIDARSFSMWIEQIKPVEASKDTLVLAVDNDFAATWIENNYLALMTQVLSAALPEERRKIELKVVTDEPLPPPTPPPASARKRATPVHGRVSAEDMKNRTIGELSENFTFDEFVVGPSNSWAHAAALAVAQKPGMAYNPLFIYGDTGVGKTHLMQAVGNRILERPGTKVAYISTETLLNEYVDSIQNRTTIDFRNKYRGVDALLIDDIQFIASKSGIQEEFFHTFNALFMARKQIIITSDRPASEIAGLEQRLVSRFSAGMTTQIECPNYETRLAILRYKQASAGNQLSDEVQQFIAENVTSSVRALEGAMNRVVLRQNLTPGEPLTIEMLRYLLRDLLEKEKQGDLTLETIQRAVAEFFDIRRTDLLSEDRSRSVAVPRQIAMYLCRKLTRASFPGIGAAFEKSHGAVCHACKQVQGFLAVEPDLRANVRAIVEKLGQDPAILDD